MSNTNAKNWENLPMREIKTKGKLLKQRTWTSTSLQNKEKGDEDR